MFQLVSREEAAPTRRPGIHGRFMTDYFGSYNESLAGPQAFLVECPEPGGVIRPHFHGVDQFQVIVGGDGRIGKLALDAGFLHYADAYTPYGPIVGGSDGISFFTLRPAAYAVSHYMPESRAEMPGRAGRSLHANFRPAEAPGGRQELLAEPDGVSAVHVSVERGQRLDISTIVGDRDAFLLVMSGSADVAGKHYGRWSCGFADGSEPLPKLVAGPAGVTGLVLTFRRPTRAHPAAANAR